MMEPSRKAKLVGASPQPSSGLDLVVRLVRTDVNQGPDRAVDRSSDRADWVLPAGDPSTPGGQVPAVAAGSYEVHAVVVDGESRLFLGDTGGLGERPLQAGRGGDVDDLAARFADEVVVVAGQVLGQFEAAVVVATGHPAEGLGIDEGRDVAIGRTLGDGRRSGEYLRDAQGPAGRREGLDQSSPRCRIALLHLGQPHRDFGVQPVDGSGAVSHVVCS